MPNFSDIGFCIKQIHDRLEKQANNAMRTTDLTIMQVSVLMLLQDTEEQQLSMKELESRLSVAQSTVAGVVSRLEQKGFVEALGDPSDRRIKRVHITPAGEICCAEAVCHKEEAEQKLLQGFSQEERDTLGKLLARAAKTWNKNVHNRFRRTRNVSGKWLPKQPRASVRECTRRILFR